MTKQSNIKPTEKQKRAVKKMTENHGNVSKSMRQAGYTYNTAKKPSNLTNSKGFEQLCKNAGLTDDFILNCLTEDIEKKPQNRKGELELATKIRGLIVERKEIKLEDITPTEEKKKTIGDRLKDLL